MPQNVARFEILMYLSIVMTALIGLLDFSRFAPIVGARFIVGMVGFTIAATALLVWLIARRRQNWARWLLLVLFLVGIPGYAMAFAELAQDATVTTTMSIMRVILQAAALYYIFTGAARDWFGRRALA